MKHLAILFTLALTLTGCLSSDQDVVVTDPATDPAAMEGGWVDCRTGGYGQGICKECGRNGGSENCCRAIEASGLTCEVFCNPGAEIPDKKGIIRGCWW